MRLSTDAITAIKKPEIRIKLAIELRCTDQSINKYIKANEFNGPLTTAGALAIIRQETGLTDDQILESNVEKVVMKG
jgi:hypothetical protein